jgi:hypothetical protein
MAIKTVIIIGLMIGLIICIICVFNFNHIENLSQLIDDLKVPDNPVELNDIEIRSRGRIITIDKFYKLDKYDRVEYISYSKPKPEQGETHCSRVKCPKHLDRVICFKCT